ncbi:hypothetical protein [Calothrix sp. 336/3]|uniref:hypothetical protein n=1 Tax=Calothrix sp. 336/3 TaxID=1337936 RepID=UPI0004E45351|nr:hypothetical protein [Calothrix sp. 336/3]AKG20410.1 hypothetical protein IJ00_02905 [Calothrix sp. 336/3]
MPPQRVEAFLNYCEQRIARFQQANNTGLLEILCSLDYRGYGKVECRCGDFQHFLISPEDLAIWKTHPLSRQRENLETIEQVLAKLDSALFETFCLQQGYATILAWYRGQDGLYGFQFSPSIVHGIKPC